MATGQDLAPVRPPANQDRVAVYRRAVRGMEAATGTPVQIRVRAGTPARAAVSVHPQVGPSRAGVRGKRKR